MDDFLYNLRKSIKDKRKDRNRRSYDNTNYRGVERRTGADRRAKKPAKTTPSQTVALIDELVNKGLKDPLASVVQCQKRIADANDRLLDAEERKIKALDRIAAAIQKMVNPDEIPDEVPMDDETSLQPPPIVKETTFSETVDEPSTETGLDPAVSETILTMRNEGVTYKNIADHLNEINAPTYSGRGRWHAQAVSKYYRIIADSL